MKYAFLNNWTFSRLLRLLFGIAVIVQAVVDKNILIGLMGMLIAGMAVLNMGCCGAGGCIIPGKKHPENKKDSSHEEVV